MHSNIAKKSNINGSDKAFYAIIVCVCFIFVSAICLLACFKSGYVSGIDADILKKIVQNRSACLDCLALFFSLPVNLGCMTFITLTVLVLSYLKRRRHLFFSCIISVCGASLCSAVLKLSVARPRPGLSFLPIVNESFFSMPSGHSASAASLLLTMLLCLLRSDISAAAKAVSSVLISAFILGVAWSRLYLAVHYPCDVAAGLTLGAGWACLGCCLAESILKRLKEKAA